MKSLVSASQPLGGDGGLVSESVSLDQGFIIADVQLKFPLAKVVTPVTDLIDSTALKIEAAFPLGGGTKAVLDPIIAGLKAEIVALLGAI